MATLRLPRAAEESAISAWLADHEAVTRLESRPKVFVAPIKPGPRAKPGSRYASGDLRPASDKGSDELQAHRIELTGSADDKRASYPLGVLYARRLILRDDHYAGRRYTALFTVAVRPLTIASTLASLIAGLGSFGMALLEEGKNEEKLAVAQTDYRSARAAMSPVEAQTVDAICVYEDEHLLRRMLSGTASRSAAHLESGLDKLFRHFEAADERGRAARAA